MVVNQIGVDNKTLKPIVMRYVVFGKDGADIAVGHWKSFDNEEDANVAALAHSPVGRNRVTIRLAPCWLLANNVAGRPIRNFFSATNVIEDITLSSPPYVVDVTDATTGDKPND